MESLISGCQSFLGSTRNRELSCLGPKNRGIQSVCDVQSTVNVGRGCAGGDEVTVIEANITAAARVQMEFDTLPCQVTVR